MFINCSVNYSLIRVFAGNVVTRSVAKIVRSPILYLAKAIEPLIL